MAKPDYYTAVVFIHGIGEQKPMDEVRSFAKAVLPGPEPPPKYHSKPNKMSPIYELRKLQNRYKPGEPRIHFFEYYWAHRAEGTTLAHVLGWAKNLFLRLPWHVSRNWSVIYFLSWILIIAAIIAAIFGVFNSFFNEENHLPWYITGAVGGVWAIIQAFLISSVGDMARYLSPVPSNIEMRRKIRANGIELLRKIHESKDPKYNRVIIVGHSLGSVIALDIMKHLWEEYYATYKTPKQHEQLALKDVEVAGVALQKTLGDKDKLDRNDEKEVEKFQKSQYKLWKELRELGNPWLITDFISMGSVLSQVTVMMAKDLNDLEQRQTQRELPVCPPVADECIVIDEEKNTKQCGYSYERWDPYEIKDGDAKLGDVKLKVLHHAGLFACTRWTNLYYPAYLGLFGDIVGWPLRKLFGAGIRDIRLTKLSKWFHLAKFTMKAHSCYWLPKKEGKKEEEATTILKEVLALYNRI